MNNLNLVLLHHGTLDTNKNAASELVSQPHTAPVNRLVAHDQIFHSVPAACAGTPVLQCSSAPVQSAPHWRPASLQTGCWSISSEHFPFSQDLSVPNLLRRAHLADRRLQQRHRVIKREKKDINRTSTWSHVLILDTSLLLQGLSLV